MRIDAPPDSADLSRLLASAADWPHVPVSFREGMVRRRDFVGVGSACGLACIFSGVIGAVLANHIGHSTYSVSYADFISILLTAISLILAVLAFVIGILAFVGWNSISSKVQGDLVKYLDEGFRPGSVLHSILSEKAIEAKNRAPFSGVPPFDAEFEKDAKAEAVGERNA